MRTGSRRQKLSTTISPDSHAFLEYMVKTGRAATMAEAVDWIVEKARQAENRARLERDTAAYFAGLSRRAARDEARLGKTLGQAVDEVNFEL
ncbi:MAG: hypothetical protein ACRD35_08380 [Candidatus Acidiferrales bacterium]